MFNLIKDDGENFTSYNVKKFADKEINVWAGCVSTAEAQLLRYWRFPQRAHGTVWFYLGQLNEQMFMYNLGHTKFDWQILSPQYPRTQEERDARDRLQAVCGMTLFPKYGEDKTPAYLLNIFSGTSCILKP